MHMVAEKQHTSSIFAVADEARPAEPVVCVQARAHPTLSPLHDCNGAGGHSEESPDSGAAAEADLHDIKSLSDTQCKAAQEVMQNEAQSQLKQGTAALLEVPSSPSEPDAAHFVGFQQLLQAPVPPPEALQYQLCRRTSPQATWPQSTEQVLICWLTSRARLAALA